MKFRHITFFLTAVAFLICGLVTHGQAPGAANPAPMAGLTMEPVQGKGGNPEMEFTNHTASRLGILYGKTKFVIKPGKTSRVKIPEQQVFDLKIYEENANADQVVPRFVAKVARIQKKHFIPMKWAKPHIAKAQP